MNNSNLFVAGKSGNETGRPVGTRYSVKTLKGRIERFLNRNMSAKTLQAMFNKLSEKDRAQFLIALMPFIMPRQSMDALSTDQIDELYSKITEALKQGTNAKVG
jgi:hypothetical protein